MKASRLVLVFLFLVFSFQLVSCCGSDNEPPPTNAPPELPGKSCSINSDLKPDHPYYSILVDKNLTDDKKEAIYSSLSEWCELTNHTFRYDLIWVNQSELKESFDLKHTIYIFDKDPGPGLAGWATWQSENFAAYMYIHPNLDKNTYRKVLLHELGHSFDLDFMGNAHYTGPSESVMYPSIGDSSEHLSCPELTSFCSNYKCDTNCIYVDKKEATSSVTNNHMCGYSLLRQ